MNHFITTLYKQFDKRMNLNKQGIQYIGVTALVALLINVTYKNVYQNPKLSNTRARYLDTSIPEKDPMAPELAWILAYPCTGSDYFIDVLHKLTGKTTATNYGHTLKEANGVTSRNTYESVPVFKERQNGPWLYTHHLPLPEQQTYLPTLSYCGGYCARCFPGRYMLKRDAFIKQCVTGTEFKPSDFNNGENEFGWTEDKAYDGEMIKKAGIVVRNPLDVVESRFLYYSNVYAGELDWSQRYDQNRKGFLAYCAENQVKYADEEAKWWNEEVRMAGLDIPCYAEFYKLVQWHNLVTEMIDYLGMDDRYFYYETFQNNFTKQARNVLGFYHLSPQVAITDDQAPSALRTSSTTIFTAPERQRIGRFIYQMANTRVRALLKPYGLYIID